MLGPVTAGTSDSRVLPVIADTSATVMPISVDDGEPRRQSRLRDALRQHFEDMDDPYQPYRLSAEERQRMREQLRSQPPYANQKK